jgi:hypothetical protein
VPNWATSAGAGVPTSDGSGVYYGYDACRTPWRIALDYCMNGEPRAKAYLDKLVGFFAGISVIQDGYTVAGQNPPGVLGDYAGGMAFYGPVGVAASAAANTALLNTEWTTLVGYTTTSYRNGPGIFTYYHASWGVLSLMTLSGNFWDMTQ